MRFNRLRLSSSLRMARGRARCGRNVRIQRVKRSRDYRYINVLHSCHVRHRARNNFLLRIKMQQRVKLG